MDYIDLMKTYAQTLLISNSSYAAQASDSAFVITDLARTWRYSDPDGPINDDNIGKLDLLSDQVHQIARKIIEKTEKTTGYNNLPNNWDDFRALFDETSELMDKLQKARDEFIRWYKALSKTHFKQEYDI